MAAPRHFSEAEMESALQIIKRYGEVSSACGNEVRLKLDRYVSDKTLRNWRRDSLQPKRLHHRKTPDNGSDTAPLLVNLDEPVELSPETDELTGLDIAGKLEFTIHDLLKLTSAERASLPAEKRLRLVPSLLEALNKSRGVDDAVLALLPDLKALLSACARQEVDPKSLLETITTGLTNHVRPPVLDVDAPAMLNHGEPDGIYLVQIEQPIEVHIQEESNIQWQ